MRIEKRQHYYYFPELEEQGIAAGFSDGTARGVYPGDAEDILGAVGIGSGIAYLKQVHGPVVCSVQKEGEYEGDGIFTTNNNLALFIRTADCMPVYFYDTKTRRIGLVHMGWRSANTGILDNVPENLEDHVVILGAGMRKCCYEVGEDFSSLPVLSRFVTARGGALFFDPVGFIRENMLEKALEPANFIDTGICTVCSNFDVLSFRKENTDSRTLSFIAKTY